MGPLWPKKVGPKMFTQEGPLFRATLYVYRDNLCIEIVLEASCTIEDMTFLKYGLSKVSIGQIGPPVFVLQYVGPPRVMGHLYNMTHTLAYSIMYR